ncbi:MAG: DNA internalization-related competence protein ComEC/Rec2 [Desulfarculaceae bacterium]|jgi:competence protein ComEC
MSLHPLVLPAAALVTGILSAEVAALSWWPLFLGGAALFMVLLLWQGLSRGRFSPWLLTPFFFLLGAGLLACQRAQELPPEHISRWVNYHRQTLVADMVQAPQPGSWGPQAVVRARFWEGRPVTGLVRLGFAKQVSVPGVGRRFSARVRLKPIVSFANPGCFDYAAHMARQGIQTRAWVGKRAGLTGLGPAEMSMAARLVQRARQRLGRLFDQLPPGQERGLLRALILGQRGELSSRLRDSFGALGTAHLLAISGLHLGLVWGLGYLVLRLSFAAWPGLALRWPVPKLAALGALVPCAAYAALAGLSTPTLRALVMAACLVAALFWDRPYRPAGGLALAALIICIIWPQAPLTLSFQLSFVAVASILMAAGPLARRMGSGTFLGRALGILLGWLLVSAVVAVAIWPLTVMHFHQLPWLSVPANALLMPLVGLVTLPLALLGAFLSLFWAGAGAAIWEIALFFASAAVNLVQALADIKGAVVYLAGPKPLAVVFLYAASLLFFLLRGDWRWLAGGAALFALVMAVMQAAPQPPDGRLTVWVVDVGQGSAAVARLPQGQVLVVDGGGWAGGDFDFGKNVMAPFLWSQGITQVDILIASHGHPDHTGGLAFLARWFKPRQVWTNGSPPDSGPYGRLLISARQGGVEIRQPPDIPRHWQWGGARLHLVWPPAGGFPPGLNENDRSLWLGLGLGRCWLWLPGDAGPAVERKVAPTLSSAGQTVLVAAHHGGKGSCTKSLLQNLKPDITVFSAGCGNSFGLPRPEVTARVKNQGARIFRTSQNGCVKLMTDGQVWNLSTHLSQPRNCPGPGM